MFSLLFDTSPETMFESIKQNDLDTLLEAFTEYTQTAIEPLEIHELHLDDGNIMECAILHRADDIIAYCREINCIYSKDLYRQLRYQGRVEEMNQYFPESGECSVCGLDGAFVYLHECCHAFCRECLDGWFQAHIDSFKFTIRCPQKDCMHEVHGTDVLACLSCERRKRIFEEKSFELAVQKIEGFLWCPQCQAPGFGEAGKHCAECTHCDHRFCPQCLEDNHLGWSCAEYAEMKDMDEDQVASFWIAKKAKVCPSCKVPIEKNGGCSHMSCQSCAYQFCWICGRMYNGSYVFADSGCSCASNPHPEDKHFEEIPVIWAGTLA